MVKARKTPQERLFEACENADIDAIRDLSSRGVPVHTECNGEIPLEVGLRILNFSVFSTIWELWIGDLLDPREAPPSPKKGKKPNESVVTDGVEDSEEREHQKAEIHRIFRRRHILHHVIQLGESSSEIFHFLVKKEIGFDVMDSEGRSPADLAFELGVDTYLILLLERGSKLNEHRRLLNGMYPLLSCASAGQVERIRILVEKASVNIQLRDQEGKHALRLAVDAQEWKSADYLLSLGSPAEEVDIYGYTILHSCVSCGNYTFAASLIENGASINRSLPMGTPLLHEFLLHRRYADAEKVLQLGASIEVVDGYGNNAVHVAVGTGDIELVRLVTSSLPSDAVLRKNCLNSPNLCDQTPLHRAVLYGNEDIVRLLCELGSDVHTADAYGRTLLHIAARYNHVSLIRFLCEQGCAVDAFDSFYRTPMYEAMDFANEDAVCTLCDLGAYADLYSFSFGTLLIESICLGFSEATRSLLKSGANPNCFHSSSPSFVSEEEVAILFEDEEEAIEDDSASKKKKGKGPTPEELAEKARLEQERQTEMKRRSFLLTANRFDLLRKGHQMIDTERALLPELSRFPNMIFSTRGFGALHCAVLMRDVRAVISLLASGSSVETSAEILHQEMTPLHVACLHGESPCAFALLRYGGASCSALTSAGQSPLSLACASGADKICQWLVRGSHGNEIEETVSQLVLEYNKEVEELAPSEISENGPLSVKEFALSSVQTQDQRGRYCIHYAAEANQGKVIETLVDCGADPNWTDLMGCTPLHLAVRSGSLKAAESLIHLGARIDAIDHLGRNPLLHAAEGGHSECGVLLVRAWKKRKSNVVAS